MKNEQMLKLTYKTDMPAGDQIDCYLSCNIRNNKGKLKKLYDGLGFSYSSSVCPVLGTSVYKHQAFSDYSISHTREEYTDWNTKSSCGYNSSNN